MATNVGTRNNAPSMFKKRRTASRAPIQAWNLNVEKIQKIRPMVRVVAIITIDFPLLFNVFTIDPEPPLPSLPK